MQLTEKQQEEFREILATMEDAFDQFVTDMHELRADAQVLQQQVQQRVDQSKIDELHQSIKQQSSL